MNAILDANQYLILPIANLGEREQLAVASLIYRELPKYYNLIPLEKDDLIELIAYVLLSERANLADYTHALISNSTKSIVGVYSAFPATELPTRDSFELMAMMDFKEGLFNASSLKAIKQNKSTVSTNVLENSYYLSRLALAEDHRGKGLADVLLQHFFVEGKEYNLYSLHVAQDNSRAIRFYEKNGFTMLPDENPEIKFSVMTRSETT
jgi:ribosomal protein S18 acetylase RimI-like enzyme